MFSRLLVAVLLLLPLLSSADDFIRTEAWGKTEAIARHNAFVKAIEIKIGVLMLSDRETSQFKQAKNDIYAYSDGYISEYKLVSSLPSESGIRVQVDSKVTTSKIRNRILIGGHSNNFDGNNVAASFDTYVNSQVDVDSLVRKVARHYPTDAYVITPKENTIRVTPGREMSVEIHYSSVLDKEFTDNLKETLEVIANPNIKEYLSKIIIGSNTYYIDDSVTNDILMGYLNPRNIRLKINLEDESKVLYSTCKATSTFVKFNNTTVTFIDNQLTNYTVEITDRKLASVIENVTKIKILMVNKQECNT